MPSSNAATIAAVLLIFVLFIAAGGCSHQQLQSNGVHTEAIPKKEEAIRIEGSFEFEGLKGNLIAYIKEPDHVRVELYGAMNSLILVVAGYGKSCRYYSEGRLKSCRWRKSLLLEPEEFVAILTGGYSRLKGWHSLKDGTGRVVALERHMEGDGDGAEPLRIRIDAYMVEPTGGGYKPSTLTIESGQRRLRLRLKSYSRETVEAGLFRLGV